MSTDRDISAIATWTRHDQGDDPNDGPRAPAAYCCTVCDWHGRGEEALRHYRSSGHAVRGRKWPATWPDARFGTPPALVSVCAWCSDSAEKTAAVKARGGQVTHGCCARCAAKLAADPTWRGDGK